MNITDQVILHYLHDNKAYIYDRNSDLSVIRIDEDGLHLENKYHLGEDMI